jgi:hypothetical protein
MSGAKTRAVPEINLEEFERRLRAAGAPPQGGVEDPLSELTRLVNTIASERPRGDAERPRGEKVVDISTARLPRAEQLAAPPPQDRAARAPLAAREPARPATPEPNVEEPAPLLRAAIVENGPADMAGENSDEHLNVSEPTFQSAQGREDGEPPEALEPAATRRPARARSWYLKVGGLGALAMLMVGGAAALKVGVPGLHKAPPLILAADGPSKVAPPNEAAVQSAGDTGALLLKDSATSAPPKLVTTEEQPIDLHAQTPTPVSAPGPSPSPTEAAKLAPAPDTPIIAPSEGAAGAPSSGPTLFPSPKRVKTVSVRPDGTLISSDTMAPPDPSATQEPVATSPVRKPDTAGAAALPATPTLELGPKSSARVAVAKLEAPADAASAPPDSAPPARAEKAEKPAKLPTKLSKPKPKPTPAPEDATPASADAGATPSFEPAPSGGWAVQLAAPRTEEEARSAITRLQGKYGDDLGSTPLGIHKAEVKGETIYRVRAGGLSKSAALAMCSKLKANGGDCFVSRQ